MSALRARCRLAPLAACLLACASAGAQSAGTQGTLPPPGANYLVEEMQLLPPRFFVGDSVELRLRLRVDGALRASRASPDSLPEDPWFDLHRVEIDERHRPGEGPLWVRVFFTPFRPGSSVLPTLVLGDLELSGVEVVTASVLEGQEKPVLRGLRGPLAIPFTGLRLLGAALAVVAAPAAAAFAAASGARGLRQLAQLRRRRRPYARLQRTVERLRAGAEAGGGERRDFFILLSVCLKQYLSERLRRSVMSATTSEIGPQLAAAGLDPGLAEEVHDLLAGADLVKFSGQGGSRREMQADLGRLERIAARVEESYADVEP